jgi:uncharacterized membrane protein HdeD (DUF308 family)
VSWETVGWCATVCFALSGLPLAWGAVREGRTSVPWSTIALVLGGSLGMLAFEAATTGKLPMLADFALNALCWGVVGLVKLISEEIA